MQKLLDHGHFFEGARWRDGHWWVSDLYAHQILRISPAGKAEIVAHVAGQPSGLGWLADGTMIAVSMKDRRIYRIEPDGSTQLHCDIHALTRCHANDMATDSRGNAYVGNLGFNLFIGDPPKPADLVHVTPDGTGRIVATDLLFPNGMVVTQDDRTLIVAETFGGRLTAFTIADDGSLYERRVWAEVGILPPWTDNMHDLLRTDIMPDGCTIDDEGCIWLADAMGSRVVRVAEGQGIIDQIDAPPGMGLYSCALGGPDRSHLLICTAPDYAEENREAAREAALYVIDLAERKQRSQIVHTAGSIET